MEEEYDAPNTNEEVTLPRATLQKLIQSYSSIGIAKPCYELFHDIAIEFIHLVSSESNEICEKEGKKTIAGIEYL